MFTVAMSVWCFLMNDGADNDNILIGRGDNKQEVIRRVKSPRIFNGPTRI